jgi:hypothetical protein
MSVYGSLTVNYDLDIYNKNLLFWDIPRIPNCRTQVSYNNSPNLKLKINTDIDRPVLGFSGLKKQYEAAQLLSCSTGVSNIMSIQEIKWLSL